MSDQIIAPGLMPASTPQPLSMAVTIHGAQAVLHLSEPREYVALTAQEALQMGARLFVAAVEADKAAGDAGIAAALAVVDAIYELRGEIKPAGGAIKAELIERHRKTLRDRLRVVLNSQREKRTVNNAQLSRQLVDICLSEVFG